MAATIAMNAGRELVEALLPHRAPLLFVDAIREFTPGARPSLLATYAVRGDETWLHGHFPARPVWPGALLLEGLAQTAGLLIHLAAAHGEGREFAHPASTPTIFGVLAGASVKFRHLVEPPAELQYRARLLGAFAGVYRFDVEAVVTDQTVADGSLSLALQLEGGAPG